MRDKNLLLFVLAVGVFGILNTEMGVVGVLPQVAERFSVSVPDAGLLVSGFALVVAVAGPTMPLLFSRVNRKTVMLLALGVFSACNAVSVFASSFEVLLAARIAPAAFHPLYVSMALAVAAQTGRTAAESAKASSRVFVGVSAGMVLGVPVASCLASMVSLSASMAFFAVVTIAVFVATLMLVPSMPVGAPLAYGAQLAILRKPVLWASLLTVALVNGAMFGFYSFLADFLGTVSGMGAVGVGSVLLFYGAANIVGNVLSGKMLAGNATRTLMIVPFALAACYAALFVAGTLAAAAIATALVLGVLAGIMNNANQYLVARAAPEAPDFSNGLYLTAANAGTTLGTALCGLIITLAGTRFAPAGALALLAAGVVSAAVRLRLSARGASGDGALTSSRLQALR
ncbi:MFS transporter [Gordonibacter sp. An230]|uniref:MFS transporter n=1 Tax=Gordonibacter sp. An230 TaxID=1965592 RepID=UPI0019524628|nr:MFS transporter [Gordonibacter sp. An230]